MATPTNSRTKNMMKRGGAMRLPMVRAAAMRRQDRAIERQRKGARMAWFYLILGGLFEVGFTTALRFVDGFKNVPWTIAFLVSVAISMALLELAARTIPMGTAYAVWGGIGAVGTVLVGMAFFSEPTTTIRLLLILGIVGCIATLKLTA